ncbi:MAG: FAD-binding protein [Rhodospirillaceae bacterium]|nr:FAD-binding protein [Rhodospirillaceae bacterium]MYB13027.1 FAD-binding protein [Rhodospirillaceae bacterium]MYI51140.1 FAD-binding protein [Rhodospirillaceae bacterium]
MTIDIEWRDYDVIVVGSGGSGGQAARAAADAGARVLSVSKDPVGASDTKISEGIATVRGSGAADDSEEVLSENLKMAGGDLPVRAITDAFARDSTSAYDRYRTQGLRPPIKEDRSGPQPLPLPFGGHTRRRSVGHKNSGIAFGHANWNAIVQGNRVDYIEDAWFLDLVTEDASNGSGPKKRIVGGLVYDAARGVLIAVRAPSVVIAAGGLSSLYFPNTDTMRGNTGDGYAIALRAGADLVDMEQVQFLPFCLASPPAYEGLCAGEPVMASYLGVLRDRNGKIILDGVFMRTRAECAAAILRAVEDGRGSPNGGAYLDMTANKELPLSGPYFQRFGETCLPSSYNNARQALGKKAAKFEEPWEVRPGAHYHMGGIRADANGASAGGAGDGDAAHGIAGLFTAGGAMGGVFGANRLGSTSLTEGAVFGGRSGRAAAAHARETGNRIRDDAFQPLIDRVNRRFGQKGTLAAATLKLELQRQAWKNIGPVRTAEKLDRMDETVAECTARLDAVAIPAYGMWNQAFIEFQELRNLLDCARAVAAAARERDGSLGGHVRFDRKTISVFSKPYSTVVRLNDDGWQVARLERERTPMKRLISYKVEEARRKIQLRWLRMLPRGVKDRKLLARYRAIMGKGAVEEISAPAVPIGSTEAATGESTRA